jgi:Arc-like DNA binding dprotein
MIANDNVRFLVTLPLEIKEWLQERAKYHCGSQSSEIVRSVRERMQRETEARATDGA